jgi:hypothetical protein
VYVCGSYGWSINGVYLPTQHYPVGLCNGEAVCLLWYRDYTRELDSSKSLEDVVMNSGASCIIGDREHPRLWILTAQKAVYLSAYLVPLCTRSASVCSNSKLLTPCPLDYSSEAVAHAYLSSDGSNASEKWYGFTKVYLVLRKDMVYFDRNMIYKNIGVTIFQVLIFK